jgi:hypothetical protein
MEIEFDVSLPFRSKFGTFVGQGIRSWRRWVRPWQAPRCPRMGVGSPLVKPPGKFDLPDRYLSVICIDD